MREIIFMQIAKLPYNPYYKRFFSWLSLSFNKHFLIKKTAVLIFNYFKCIFCIKLNIRTKCIIFYQSMFYDNIEDNILNVYTLH